jgi:hypothetical protein
MLATAIGIILMGALYAAVRVELRQAQVGREAIEQSTLVRAVSARITNDIIQSLGSINSAASGSSSANLSGSSAGQTGSTMSGSSAGSSAPSPSTPSSSNSTASSNGSSSGTYLVNLGVQGDSTHLILSVSRLPREFSLGPNSDSATNQQTVSDLRRISYWLVGDNGSAQGLAWQEFTPVTSDDALNAVPPNIPDEASHIIAEEIKSLTFSYFDGNAWQDTWDGTVVGADGVTPIGPPAAIAIVMGVQGTTDRELKTYRHVVAIPTASNQQNSSSTGATSSSGTAASNLGNTGP